MLQETVLTRCISTEYTAAKLMLSSITGKWPTDMLTEKGFTSVRGAGLVVYFGVCWPMANNGNSSHAVEVS